MYAAIQPVPAFPKPAVALFINNVTVWPSSEAQFGWTLRDADGAQVGFGILTLSGDAYAAWGTDDDYLYTYPATQLGLTIIEIVPDAPPAPPEPVITAPPVLPDGAPAAPVAADPVPAPSNE